MRPPAHRECKSQQHILATSASSEGPPRSYTVSTGQPFIHCGCNQLVTQYIYACEYLALPCPLPESTPPAVHQRLILLYILILEAAENSRVQGNCISICLLQIIHNIFEAISTQRLLHCKETLPHVRNMKAWHGHRCTSGGNVCLLWCR